MGAFEFVDNATKEYVNRYTGEVVQAVRLEADGFFFSSLASSKMLQGGPSHKLSIERNVVPYPEEEATVERAGVFGILDRHTAYVGSFVVFVDDKPIGAVGDWFIRDSSGDFHCCTHDSFPDHFEEKK